MQSKLSIHRRLERFVQEYSRLRAMMQWFEIKLHLVEILDIYSNHTIVRLCSGSFFFNKQGQEQIRPGNLSKI